MTPAKEIDGELWIKVDDHHRAVGAVEAEWRTRCDTVKQEASYWHKRHDATMDAVVKNTLLLANTPITLMAEPQSFNAGKVLAERQMMQLFTDPENQPTQHGTVTVDYMQREIAAEREACAKVCDEHARVALSLWHKDIEANKPFWNGEEQAADRCAEAIRARGITPASTSPHTPAALPPAQA